MALTCQEIYDAKLAEANDMDAAIVAFENCRKGQNTDTGTTADTTSDEGSLLDELDDIPTSTGSTPKPKTDTKDVLGYVQTGAGIFQSIGNTLSGLGIKFGPIGGSPQRDEKGNIITGGSRNNNNGNNPNTMLYVAGGIVAFIIIILIIVALSRSKGAAAPPINYQNPLPTR
jgi:flagellar biosynthesis/type III secretory pathway M-ring protein FliF/YscJ